MTSQSAERILNLGKYSIRPSKESSDLRVGAFWKRQQNRDAYENSEKESTQEEPSPKRLAIVGATSGRPISRPRGSIASQSISLDSDTPTTSQHNDRASTNTHPVQNDRLRILEDRLNGRDKSDRIARQASSEESNCPLLIDTQASCSSAKIDEDDTHESVVINVNPAAYYDKSNDGVTDEQQTNVKSTHGLEGFMFYTPNVPKRMRKKTYPKQMPYDKIMSNVTFVMSGYENPRRSKLRDLALEMGAKYQANWNRFCTHLICAFKNTPKYKEVMAENGRIVREHWIQECSRQRQLLDWRNYTLGKYPCPDSEEEVNVDDLDYALETGYGVKQPAAKH